MFLRKLWVRVLLTIIVLLVNDFLGLYFDYLNTIRPQYLSALQSIIIIFAIITTISMTYFMITVNGIRDNYMTQVRNLRKHIWEFYERYISSDNVHIRSFMIKTIFPLLQLNLDSWLCIDNVKNWSRQIEEDKDIINILKNGPDPLIFMYKYLLPLEDEMNELGILAIRSVLTTHSVSIIKGAFYLVVFAMAIIIAGHVVPRTPFLDLIIINMIIAVTFLAIIEFLVLISFFAQQAREEYLEPSPNSEVNGKLSKEQPES